MRLAILMVAIASPLAAAELPTGWTLTGEGETRAEAVTATGAATLSGPVSPGQQVELALSLVQVDAPLTVRVVGPGREAGELTLTAAALPKSPWHWKKETMADAGIKVALRRLGQPWLFRESYWIRPNPHFCHRDDLKQALDGWSKLPPASRHRLHLRLDVVAGAARLWLDDRFIGRVDLAAREVQLALKAGHVVHAMAVRKLAVHPGFVTLRLAGYGRAGEPGKTKHSLGLGRQTVGGVPFEVAAPGGSIDVGLSRWLMESVGPDDFTDDYYTRSAFDGTPESILLTVPTDDYGTAHLLCAVDPDPAKAPVLTLRLTRFLTDLYDSGGRGDGIADTVVRLDQENGRWPDGVTPVGTVELDTARGPQRVPLLHVRARLDLGAIQDVLDETGLYYRRSTEYLDLELTKALGQVVKQNYANFSTKPLGRPSAVRVFGLTLERAPVRARLRSKQIGNVFTLDELPGLSLELTNPTDTAFRGTVECRVAEAPATRSEVTVAPGETKAVTLDARAASVGWYPVSVRLLAGDEPIWKTASSFAVVPQERRADPRFGVWWFRRIHVGTSSIDAMAPLLNRLGVAHVCPSGRGPSGAELAKHGLSISMYPNRVRGDIAKAEEAIDAMVKEHPGVRWALIFHENGFGEKLVLAPEFRGEPVPKLTEEQGKRFKTLWDKAVAVSRIYRRKHPDIQLIFGNASVPFAAEFMRRGYPGDLVDAFGDEDVGQLMMPEIQPQTHKSMYWLKEYAKRYHYDVPVTTPYEWRCRPTTPGNLTEREQAELYARDCLQALAFGMPTINAGLLHDVGDAYYYSRWGGTGLCHRYPLLHPKPSYVAMATLIHQLAGAECVRYLPSNSPSLYILEFRRQGRRIYALWVPRGRREVTLTFDRATADATWRTMLGAATALGWQTELTREVSSSTSYLELPDERAAIVRAVAGPTACEPPPRGLRAVDDLCDLGRWKVATERDKFLETAHFDFPRRQGKVNLRVVDDKGKGRALEVELLPQPGVPAPCPRYVILAPREPIPIPGEPRAIGTWVKGNSCWGRVMWELEDAKGERFLSVSAGEGGWMVGDWRTRSFINFDGWNYLQMRLLTWYDSGFYGPERRNWRNVGGDGRVDFPVRLTRLVLELRDRVVHLTDMVPVPERSIRLRDLSVSGE